MIDAIKLALHVGLCAVVFWSCFCRQAHSTKHTTRPQIRVAFWLLAVASLTLGIAPWAHMLWPEWPIYRITSPELLMLFAIASVQLATAHYWRHGAPSCFLTHESTSS